MRKTLSFKNRILLGNLLVAILPLFIFGSLIIFIFSVTIESDSNQTAINQINDLSNTLNNTLYNSQQAIEFLSQSADIQRALVDNKSDDLKKDVYLTLYEKTNSIQQNVDLALYDAGGMLKFSTNENSLPNQLNVNWGVLGKAKNNIITYSSTPIYDLKDMQSISFQGCLPVLATNGARVGYAVFSVSLSQLSEILSASISERSSILLLNSQGRAIYASNTSILAYSELVRDSIQNNLVLKTSDANFYFNNSLTNNFSIVLRHSEMLNKTLLNLIITLAVIAGIFCILLCTITSFGLSKSLYAPIESLTKGMQNVQNGNLATRVAVNYNDELGQLTNSFNNMTLKLENYVQTEIQNQKDLNKAQIRQLQAQLNPHFLYNTLDTIKWLAKINKVPQIATLSASLASILRTSINNKQFITLKEELTLVETYINIQKIRFSDSFEYVVNLPETLQNCIIPKLIVQPLVENAIIHGLDRRPNGYIYINCLHNENKVTISVTDDGYGMPAEIVDKINTGNIASSSEHLGLYNIMQIIKLNYSSDYSITASSQTNVGSTVSITLPIKNGELKI